MRKLLEVSYAKIVSLGLTKVSPRQFDEAMREYGMTGETHKKVVSFFLQAAKYSELAMHPLLGKKTRSVGPRKDKNKESNGHAVVGIDSTPKHGAGPHGTSKTITLKTGGSLTLSVEGNFLEMGTDDRQFVFELIDKLQAYQKQE